MLCIENLSITYSRNLKPAVQDFHLEMKQGEIVCLLGESGSGKTTVLRAIPGCLPDGASIIEGDIRFKDMVLSDSTEKEIRQMRGNEISMIFQDTGTMLNPVRRIGSQYAEFIQAHEKLSGKAIRSRNIRNRSGNAIQNRSGNRMSGKDAWKKGVETLEKLHFSDGERIMRSYPFQLSGGMCQRVGIAMAVTFQPDLLLADEPTSALDAVTQDQIIFQLMELRRICGTGMIVVTHHPGVAARMADRIIVIRDGRIVETGDRDEILKQPKDSYTKKLMDSVPVIGGHRFV